LEPILPKGMKLHDLNMDRVKACGEKTS